MENLSRRSFISKATAVGALAAVAPGTKQSVAVAQGGAQASATLSNIYTSPGRSTPTSAIARWGWRPGFTSRTDIEG